MPIRSNNAEDVAVALYQFFLNMGFPSVISSDQGREFVNMLMDKLSEKLKFVQRISSAYHPQTNSLVERFNQTLKKMLIKMTSSENQDTWDDYIKEALFAYRTQIQKSLKKTPFEVMFGRKHVSKDHSIQCDTLEKSIEYLEDVRNTIRKEVKQNVAKAQEKQVAYHRKRKSSSTPYEVNDKALLYNAKKGGRKRSKMENSWFWLYTIQSVNEKGVVSLKKNNGEVLSTKYNVKLLKRFKERNISTPETMDMVSEETEQQSEVYITEEEINDCYFYPVDKIWQRKN